MNYTPDGVRYSLYTPGAKVTKLSRNLPQTWSELLLFLYLFWKLRTNFIICYESLE